MNSLFLLSLVISIMESKMFVSSKIVSLKIEKPSENLVLVNSSDNNNEESSVLFEIPEDPSTRDSRLFRSSSSLRPRNPLRSPLRDKGLILLPRPISNNGFEDEEVVKINEISCRASERDAYFGASVTTSRRTDRAFIVDTKAREYCQIRKIERTNEYRVKFDKDQFWKCGVNDCSTNSNDIFYCLTIRFPIIYGLRLKEDLEITLRCKAQDRIVSRTKQLGFKLSDAEARNAPRIAEGGMKNSFEVDVSLFRRSREAADNNVYDAKINHGGTVILGERILLRTIVRNGDGWKYSRIGEVMVRRSSRDEEEEGEGEGEEKFKTNEALYLLDTNGCRNSIARNICPSEQYRGDSPLESYLSIEAFMFDKMKENEEMTMTVKVIGCLENLDCFPIDCSRSTNRLTREIRETRRENDTTIDSEKYIIFRVLLDDTTRYEQRNGNSRVVFLSAIGIILIGAIVALLVVRYVSNVLSSLRRNVE